ncbi:MAG: TonB-dependent receptor domain-containing protein [Vicinamibacterales bacterium]
MERLTRVVSAAFVGVAGAILAGAPLAAQRPRVSTVSSMHARVMSGSISGTVIDEQGDALAGAMVSALGVTLASTVTDQRGRFAFQELPPGQYLVRAHMIGFAASSGALVRVGPSPAVHRLQLRRLYTAVGTSGAPAAPVKARPIIAAGFDLPRGAEPEAESPDAETDDHPHTETAWRLRHIKRSILKDAAPIMVLADNDPGIPSGSLFGRAVGSAASLATSLFTEFPFSGEVNFLTTGAVAPGALLSATAFPRGVAYLALAAPGTGGDWSIRAAMSEGDLSSWVMAGAFASKPGRAHTYDFGLSYSTQEYQGGNPAALAAVTDGSRNVGELYAFDTWAINRVLAVHYGARYAHYDYLAEDRGQLSPRLGFTLEAYDGARVRATVAQRMVAPGAEEFLSSSASGPWLPPERTFAPLGDPAADAFRVERARSYDVTFERDIGDAHVLGIAKFHQSVDDQLVTLFGLQMPGGPKSVGHYYVGNVGSVEADGWAVRFDTRASARLQGSIHYSLTRATWSGRADLTTLTPLAPAAVRAENEDLHDLTSSIKADIPETSTRVFVLYKLNSGFVRSNAALDRPGLDGRFDVQVNQALPVTFAGTKWEVLVGLRNLFRDPRDAASVYDELLVVRPPKRLVGGFLVRF